MHLAEKGLYTVTRNNPRVGCLLVREAYVVGRGWHQRDGGKHAEIEAMDVGGEAVRGATAYVTLEPCCWEGRTTACTTEMVTRGIARVVLGLRDPHPKVNGKGIAALEQAGVEVCENYLSELESLNPGQKQRLSSNRPWVRIKSAISFDGRTAMADGASLWITGEQAREDVQHWRARSGAILTGIGTILADDPRLNVRGEKYQNSSPWRVVLDSHVQFPRDAKMLKYPGKVVIVCGKDAVTDEVADTVDVWQQPRKTIEISHVLSQLAGNGINELLVEAGAQVTGSFLKSGLWDEFIVYMAPKFIGDSGRPLANHNISQMADTIGARVASISTFGPDIRIIFTPD